MTTNYTTIVNKVRTGDDLIELLDIHDGAYEHIDWDMWVQKNLLSTVVDLDTMAESIWDNCVKFLGAIWDDWFDEQFCGRCQKVYSEKFKNDICFCDMNDGCRFFPEGTPDGVPLVRMWLKATTRCK